MSEGFVGLFVVAQEGHWSWGKKKKLPKKRSNTLTGNAKPAGSRAMDGSHLSNASLRKILRF